jgi:16S rRNA (guanine527-N7)-methyltransferase
MRDAVIESIEKHQDEFGLRLARPKIELLADFFELIQEHNEILHLVAPTHPEEFAVRHILESLTLLEFLPENAGIADIGPGAGFPSVPCLLVRDDLNGVLIESKPRKAGFLEKVSTKFGLEDRVQILCRQFEETTKPGVQFVACRALDKFPKKLPKLIRWSKGSTLLLLSGAELGEELEKLEIVFNRRLTPGSERRYLYLIEN